MAQHVVPHRDGRTMLFLGAGFKVLALVQHQTFERLTRVAGVRYEGELSRLASSLSP